MRNVKGDMENRLPHSVYSVTAELQQTAQSFFDSYLWTPAKLLAYTT
jgi:hypothetical protein